MTERLQGLFSPVSILSLAVFRILFGGILCVGSLRFMLEGWIKPLYVDPTFFFKYPGFEWVQVWSENGLYLHWSLLAIFAFLVMIGLFYRVAIIGLLGFFAYAQLMDVTNYLNHYVLVGLLLMFMAFMPLNGAISLDQRFFPAKAQCTVPAWMLYLLRFQVFVVYFSAGLAKAGSDWLLYAQPLNIWMTARNELPIIGPILDELPTAYAMAWAGFFYDTFIVFFLLWRRTRPYAFVVILTFHGLTAVFFDIGLFPWIMTFAATLFFEPNWPARLLGDAPPARATPSAASPFKGTQKLGMALALAYAVFAILSPHRHYLYPGNVLWHEQGMRFAWKVMLREKSGSIQYTVEQIETGRRWRVSPTEYLTWRQANEFSGQPDLIVQLAKHIAHDFQSRGLGPVTVTVDALVSLNGRPAEKLIDSTIDLNSIHAGLAPSWWITPGPTASPKPLRSDAFSRLFFNEL